MARMRIPMDSSVLIRDQFKSFLLSKKAYGTADKTLATYKQHFSAISKHLDVNKPIDFLCKKDLQKMIADMRDTNLSSNTIRSYTATLKTFFCRNRWKLVLERTVFLNSVLSLFLNCFFSTAPFTS